MVGTSRSARLRLLLLVIVGLGSAGIALLADSTHVFQRLEDSSVDLRFHIRGPQLPERRIVLVEVDAKTFQDLNRQWPFPRSLHARVIDRIAADHPAAIAYDVQFSESSQFGQHDDIALLEAIDQAKHLTAFATTETEPDGNFRFLGSDAGQKLLGEVGGVGGSALLPYDSDGVIRRFPVTADGLDSLAVATAEIATRHRVSLSGIHGDQWIDFRGPAGTYPAVSFADVYRGRVPASFFRGRIVVVGASAPSLQDVHATAFDPQMAGPEIQANAIDTVLRGWPLRSLPGWVTVLMTIVLGCAVPLVSLRLGPLAATLVAVGIGGVFAAGEQVAFDAGEVGTVVYPLVGLALSGTGSLGVQLVTETFERIRVRDLFARFVPEDVVDEVMRSADGARLGGVQREGTVMFTDLRGFTAMAEPLSPTTVIDLLNHYLTEMSDAILDHGGTLVAYMGDGIMAVFGAPVACADHADRAVAAAREMLEVRLPRFNAWLRAEGISDGLEMGIGLNSGSVMSGHVGSERRVEYTAVGDTTNTAARIEQLTKQHPEMLLLAKATIDLLQTPPADLRPVTDAEIRGRVGRIELWTLGDGRLVPE